MISLASKYIDGRKSFDLFLIKQERHAVYGMSWERAGPEWVWGGAESELNAGECALAQRVIEAVEPLRPTKSVVHITEGTRKSDCE